MAMLEFIKSFKVVWTESICMLIDLKQNASGVDKKKKKREGSAGRKEKNKLRHVRSSSLSEQRGNDRYAILLSVNF